MSSQPNDFKIVNAKITSTELHPNDSDCGFQILLYWSGSDKTSGNCHFCCHEAKDAGRIIAGILEAVGFSAWEELRGKLVRMKLPTTGQGTGPSRGALAIGHIIEDQWFCTGDILHR